MFDPLSLSGPAFLLFYTIVGALVLVGLRAWYRSTESVDEPKLPALTDPYLIACLRGGVKEALRVGIFALVDRGLLTVSGKTLATRREKSIALAQRPIEKAILTRYSRSGHASGIFYDIPARDATDTYTQTLVRHGLVADGGTYGKRLLPMLAALSMLVGFAGIRISNALAQGRHNIWFLVILAVAFSIAVLWMFCRRRTARGNAVLADLKRLFERLKNRSGAIAAGGRTNEAALLAALFGITALSETTFPFLKKLYPRSSDGGGSSCSSGSGGGCGGGGGGGCGGCGG